MIIEGSPNVFVGDNVFFGDNVVFETIKPYNEQVVALHSADGTPIAYYPYFIETADGKTYSGRTDDAGLTPRIDTLTHSEDYQMN